MKDSQVTREVEAGSLDRLVRALAESCERRHKQYYVARTHDPEDEAVRRALLVVFSDLAEDLRAEIEKRPNDGTELRAPAKNL